MNKEKIEELRSARQRLQEENRLTQLRQRLARQLSYLEKSGQPVTVHYTFEHLNWIATNVLVRRRDGYKGMHGDFQIDVDDSTVADNTRITENEINTDKFREVFLALIPANTSLIVCHQGGDPELEIPAEAFLSHPSLFFSGMETWIISSDKSWIIEYISDQCVIRFIRLQGSLPTLENKMLIEEK